MKPHNARRIALRRATLRALSDDRLALAGGGVIATGPSVEAQTQFGGQPDCLPRAPQRRARPQ